MKVTPVGGVAIPLPASESLGTGPFSPQHAAVPSARIPQVV